MATVLLVHAGSDDREMYAEYLRVHGLGVIEVDTTDEASAAIAECDLVITGLLVPGTFDCVELIARTRRRSSAMPIIVVTACIVAAMREAAIAAGCDIFLLKPCYPETLLGSVWELLDRRPNGHGTPLDGTTN